MAEFTESSKKKIISFVVFGKKREYIHGAMENAKLIAKIYPGWTGRFYIGDDVPDKVVDEIKSFSHEVTRFSVEEHPNREPQIMRYYPADEPGVDAFIVRDTDSRINPREAAAVADWLQHPTARYHLMHESMHDDRYGEIMGGMWGAKRLIVNTKDDINEKDKCVGDSSIDQPIVPCPGLIQAAALFIQEQKGSAYGDDMKFLSQFLAPLITEQNCIHHVDGDMKRSIGTLSLNCRVPFPPSGFRGFVGQPVRCQCSFEMFTSQGCPHVSTHLPDTITQILESTDSNILNSITSFLS